MKKITALLLSIIFGLVFSANVYAHDIFVGPIAIENDWVREYLFYGGHNEDNLVREYFTWDNSNHHPDIYVETYASGHWHGGLIPQIGYSESPEAHYVYYDANGIDGRCVRVVTYTGYYAGIISDL